MWQEVTTIMKQIASASEEEQKRRHFPGRGCHYADGWCDPANASLVEQVSPAAAAAF
ncbi:hypothetical protein KIF59_16025 [Enterobacter cloacae subsp. cloacae]|nr:hypothetical protein [Enterobacter cloacae subsp. cloacae]